MPLTLMKQPGGSGEFLLAVSDDLDSSSASVATNSVITTSWTLTDPITGVALLQDTSDGDGDENPLTVSKLVFPWFVEPRWIGVKAVVSVAGVDTLSVFAPYGLLSQNQPNAGTPAAVAPIRFDFRNATDGWQVRPEGRGEAVPANTIVRVYGVRI